MNISTPSRLQNLLGFLEHDAENLNLIADAADQAYRDGEFDRALELLDRYEGHAALPPALASLRAFVTLRTGQTEAAEQMFSALLVDAPGDSALLYNLAWCRALVGNWDSAAELLDSSVVEAVPAAATLRVQALHHLGKLDEALELGAELAQTRASDQALMGALAVAAMDNDELELAAHYARQAPGTHEGLATMGMLNLDQQDVSQAMGLFDRALDVRPDSARALIGKGLGLLASDHIEHALPYLDRGALQFGDHLGSWVAAGWGHVIHGDLAAGRERFETALALDDTFAETHGSLAVIDILQGDVMAARQRAEKALRLDRKCYSAALASSLLAAHGGNQEVASRIFNAALKAPIDGSNMTIAQAMVGFSRRSS